MFTHTFELTLIQALHAFRSPLLDTFFICCNVLDTIYFSVSIIFLTWIWSNRHTALKMGIILLISFAINKLLKYSFALPRPHDLDASLGILNATTPGFPSGAAQTAILLSGILLKEWKSSWRWAVTLLFAFTLSFSRVYLGLHFPTDLMGGWVVGLGLFWLYCKLDYFLPNTKHLQKGTLIMTTTLALTQSFSQPVEATPLYQYDSLEVGIPVKQLNPGSLYISSGQKTFQDWTKEEHKKTYQLIQTIADHWQDNTFLVYGSSQLQDPFSWEAVPYQDTNWFSNTYEDFKVGYNILNGGDEPTQEMHDQQVQEYQDVFSSLTDDKEDKVVQGNDPFCRSPVIQKQQVLEGKRIRVLTELNPLGSVEKKIHFLFIPKQHRKNFRELTQQEYKEIMKKMGFVLEQILTETPIYRIYVYHKTGRIQSIEHLHVHLVVTVNAEHDADTRAKFAWNMIFPSKLSDEELQANQTHYQNLFNPQAL